eukprot:259164_1
MMAKDLVQAKLLDGKAIAKNLRNGIEERVTKFKKEYGRSPGLSVILVGSRTDSQTYVRMKKQAGEKVGVKVDILKYDEDVDETIILNSIEALNNDCTVDGFLIQLPLPAHLNEDKILQACSPVKDVDGLHPLNVGELTIKGHKAKFIPCTPKGCVELIKNADCTISGKHAVVIGRSLIVGKPVSLVLQSLNATVTMCHSYTTDLPKLVKQADIIVVAVGIPGFLKADWVKPGAVVIDVGITSVDDPTRKRGYRLVGDVDFDNVSKIAGAITPVPGGVGPMTVAMLLMNTIESAERISSGTSREM